MEHLRDTAFAFAAEVELRIQALSDEQFYLRQGSGKLLLEEWYPISRLALHLKQPGLEVVVEAYDDNREEDACIEENGFRERLFKVQVTYVEDYENSLRRELMYRQGFVPGVGPINRLKKSKVIVAESAAVDHDHNLQRAATDIAKRFEKKAAMSYSAGTVLLIAFDEITLRGFEMWRQLLALVHERASLKKSIFDEVYIINCATNELVQAG